ncbi:hypothetical protein [Psychroserpens algicola]|uniref:Uncharacterized protein n=1 Tax=Psychroserpens algicola TaxID=1719034 RepID=A0ABT0H8V9_9FLAO|nr:hypothetical protein [Psychroserpens algicola]MCK8480796.1 hypothetical protein [Psychroserpens algicola]
MKQFFKTTLFIIAMSLLIVFSKRIQNEIIEGYNHCIAQLTSYSMSNQAYIGV